MILHYFYTGSKCKHPTSEKQDFIKFKRKLCWQYIYSKMNENELLEVYFKKALIEKRLHYKQKDIFYRRYIFAPSNNKMPSQIQAEKVKFFGVLHPNQEILM